MSLIEISIQNWEKYNPRSDRANYSWFRFENTFFNDHRTFEMNDNEIVLFIALLCEASRNNSSAIKVSSKMLSMLLKTSANKIIEGIQHLADLGVIKTADCRSNDGKEPSSLPATNVRTYERTNDIAQSADFADFYNAYPRRIGKAAASKIYLRERKAGASAEDLVSAMKRFRDHHAKLGTEPKFIPYPATFLGGWREWLDPSTGSVQVPKSRNYSDLARDLWYHCEGAEVSEEVREIASRLSLDGLHRDDFRPGGKVPAMIKALLEGPR